MGKNHEKVVLSLKDEIQTTKKYMKRRSTSPIRKECKLEPRNVVFYYQRNKLVTSAIDDDVKKWMC